MPGMTARSLPGLNRVERIQRKATPEWLANQDIVMTSSSIQDRYRLGTTERWAREFERSARWDLQWPEERERAERFTREHAPLVTFVPGRGGSSVPYFGTDDFLTPYWNLASWERPGPTIHAYSLP
jgi:hypothetical protein